VRGLGGDADLVDEGRYDGGAPKLGNSGHARILTTVVPAVLGGDPDFSIFLQHTSASLFLYKSADPDVRRDLETLLARFAPDGDPTYVHDTEGPDDMAAHARWMLTSNTITILVSGGKLMLGTWQGVYLYAHRTAPHGRNVVVTVLAESG